MIKPKFKKSYTLITGTGILLIILSMVMYFVAKTHTKFKQAIISDTQNQLLSAAKSVSASIHHEVNMLSDNLNIIAQNRKIQKSLKYINRDNLQFPGNLVNDVYQTQKSHMEAICVLDGKGQMVYHFSESKLAKTLVSLADTPDVAHVLKEHLPYISRPFYTDSGVLVFSILKPISYRGEFVGIVRWLIKIDTLADHFINHVRVRERGYAQLIDSSGTLLAIPDFKQVGRHIMERPKQLYPKQDWTSFEQLVQKMTAGREGTDIANLVCWFNDQHKDQIISKLIAYAPVSLGTTTWSVIFTIDYDEVVNPINANARTSVLFSFIIMVIVLIAGYYFFRTHEKLIRLESDERYRVLSQSAKDTIVTVNSAGIIVEWNPGAEGMFGYLKAEVLGQPLTLIMPHQFHERYRDGLTRAQAGGESHVIGKTVELVGRRKDGSEFQMELSLTQWKIREGRFYTGIIRDITKRKRAEEELTQKRQELENKNKAIEENRNKLQGALTEISTLMESVIQAKDHNVKFSNPHIKKCYEIKNCKKEDCPCYGKEAVRCWQIAGTYCGGKVQGFFAQKFGNCSKCEVYKEATADPIYQIGEHFNNMMNILKTKNKELEEAYEELQAATVKLSQSNTELVQFAYIASHDLQEPLRKVTAFGDRLKDKYAEALGERGKDYLERMQNAAGRMQTLINDLLTYSRVTTKAQPFTSTDLSTIVNEVLSDLEIRIEQVKGRVEIGELPVIDADPLQMRQLLQNLIGNALKFNKKDNPPVVKVHGMFTNCNGSAGNEYYQLTIEDNGIGFDEKYAERIFGVFQRLHGRSEYEGSGIGLSVCKKIVERHGGSITAKSTPGLGAKFIITLPVKQSIEVNA